MKVLVPETKIFAKPWGNFYLFTVSTARAFYSDPTMKHTPEEISELIKESIKRGDEQAFAFQGGTVISSNPAYYAQRDKVRATAVEVEDGEEVEIEGLIYSVKLIGKNYSDGIKFKRVCTRCKSSKTKINPDAEYRYECQDCNGDFY